MINENLFKCMSENMFKRNLDKDIIKKLQETDLWKNHLKSDCEKENPDVFFAIRNNEIGFYHKGGRLFGYDKNGFKTHFKYASVMENTDKNYLTETELSQTKLISKFSENYKRIKENCALYSGDETKGVSEIYHKNSYLNSNANIVVLDIEVSFNPTCQPMTCICLILNELSF